MFTTLDVILLVSEYVSFILEPIYEKLARRLIFRRQTKTDPYRQEAPWLLRNHKVDRTLAGLSLEMRAFYEMHRRNNSHEINSNSSSSRLSTIRLAKRMIETKWPWVAVQTAPSDPVDRLLNWLDYDLCLIDDWDFPKLAPNFSDDDDDGSCGSSKWSPMRVIHSSPVDRKLFIRLQDASNMKSMGCGNKTSDMDEEDDLKTTEQQQQQQQQRQQQQQQQQQHNYYHGKMSTLCIKWLTIDEFSLLEKRANLIFYYTQVYPDLTVLYEVVVNFLDSAQLIESASSNGHAQEPQLLSRYALVLMIAAYLNSEKATLNSKRSARRESKSLLAQHLIGFLEAYALSTDQTENRKWRIRIGPGSSSGTLHLELKRTEQASWDGEASGNGGHILIVLDPLGAKPDARGAAKLNSQLTKNDESIAKTTPPSSSDSSAEVHSTNLTKNLRSFDRLSRFFNELADHVSNNIATTTTTTKTHNSDYPTPSTATCCSSGEKTLLESLFLLSTKLGPQKPFVSSETNGFGSKSVGQPTTRQSQPPISSISLLSSVRQLGHWCRLGDLNMRKILINLLYFAIFLLIRGYFLNHLLHIRANLEEQSRDDLIKLKQQLFGGQTFRQQQDDAYYGRSNMKSFLFNGDDDDGKEARGAAKGSRNGGAHGFNQQAKNLDKMFDSLMGEKANSDDDDDDDDDEDDFEEEGDASDELIGNLFSALLSGGAGGLAGGFAGGGGAAGHLSKLMSGLGAGGEGDGEGASLAGLSQMFGGNNPADMDMSQLEAMLKNFNLMNADQHEPDSDPTNFLEHQVESPRMDGKAAEEGEKHAVLDEAHGGRSPKEGVHQFTDEL